MHFAARIIAAAIAVVTACSLLSPHASAFTIIPSQKQSSRLSSVVSTALYSAKQPSEQSSLSSRRSVLSTILATTTAASTILLTPLQPATAAAATESPLITDLQTSYTKILQIPPLLQNAEWDKVRTILKTPPVNQLWNLGENQNTVVKLAKESGNFDLLELKDELAISLQMTDQYSYDNVFIYYQPGELCVFLASVLCCCCCFAEICFVVQYMCTQIL
jgi:Leucine-rich repeat (LRR) protein